MQDVECDALIVDAPYSDRTHVGMRVGDVLTGPGNPMVRKGVPYPKWSESDVAEFVASWAPRTSGWFVSVTDHVLAPIYEAHLKAVDKYVFPPLPFLEIGKQPRLSGDGPASWTCWVVVARPKERRFQSWGSLPGGYWSHGVPPAAASDRTIKGSKPLAFVRSLIRDYSRPGDIVCDPCAGGGTTLLAALIEGRRAVGAECMPEHYEIAQRRLARGFTPTLFQDAPPAAEQLKLGGGE